MTIRKMQFIFGGITLTLTEDDIEAIQSDWEAKHPGIDMPPKKFADACMKRMIDAAKPTRTVLHN